MEMAIPPDQALITEVGLAAFAGRVPEDVRDRIQIQFRKDRQSYILLECRPKMSDPNVWYEKEVAKLTYVQTTKKWKLFRKTRNLRWKTYERIPETQNVEVLLKEIDRDPWHLFWG